MPKKQMFDLTKLKQNPNNPYPFTGTDDQWEEFKAKIEKNGKFCEANRIAYDSTQDYLIVAGNKRARAFIENGQSKIPKNWVFDCKDWSEEERHEYIVASNKNWGNWDREILDMHFEEIAFDYDLTFEDEEEEKHIEAKEDNFNTPLPKHPVTVKGDLYEIECNGSIHRLMCGDSLSVDNIEKLTQGKDMFVHTDPPYGIDVVSQTVGGAKSFGSKKDKALPIKEESGGQILFKQMNMKR